MIDATRRSRLRQRRNCTPQINCCISRPVGQRICRSSGTLCRARRRLGAGSPPQKARNDDVRPTRRAANFRPETPSTNPAIARRKFFPCRPHIGRTHETSSVLPTNCLLTSCDGESRRDASTAHQGRRSKQLARFHLREKTFRMIDATEERAKMCRSGLYVVSPASATYNILWQDGAFGRSKESGKVRISGLSSRGLAKGSSHPVPFGPPHFVRRKAKSKLVGNPAANSASRPAEERPRAARGAD